MWWKEGSNWCWSHQGDYCITPTLVGLKFLEQFFKFCFQFSEYSEISDEDEEDEEDGLVDLLLNEELDLPASDVASVRNGVSLALHEATEDTAQCQDMLLGIPLQCCMQMLILWCLANTDITFKHCEITFFEFQGDRFQWSC